MREVSRGSKPKGGVLREIKGTSLQVNLSTHQGQFPRISVLASVISFEITFSSHSEPFTKLFHREVMCVC